MSARRLGARAGASLNWAAVGPAAPEWATRWFLVAAAIGFPFAVVFRSWFYELTAEGLKREREIDPAASRSRISTGRKLDFAITGCPEAVAVVLHY